MTPGNPCPGLRRGIFLSLDHSGRRGAHKHLLGHSLKFDLGGQKMPMQGKNRLVQAVLDIAFLSLVAVGASLAAAEPVGMVTGSPSGTYFQFGRDMQAMAAGEGLVIDVKESSGSLKNIERINSDENAAFGIVQSDVLGYLKRDSALNQALARRLRVIFPFYLEEVHVLARREIKGLRELNGKRVAIGEDGSGTWLTAKNLFKVRGIVPAREETLKTEEAELKLLAGDLDAMIYVAGKPVKAFAPLAQMAAASNDPSAREAVAAVHFVAVSPVSDAEVFAEYDESTIGPEDYPWLTSEVPVAAVRAVLVGFDFSSGKSSYFKARCKQFAILGKAVRENLHALQSGEYHPKWKEVNLDRRTPVRGWEFDACSAPDVSRSAPAPQSSSGGLLQQRLRDRYFSPGAGTPGSGR
jgi:TRAP transporter TAXI family solute receptor